MTEHEVTLTISLVVQWLVTSNNSRWHYMTTTYCMDVAVQLCKWYWENLFFCLLYIQPDFPSASNPGSKYISHICNKGVKNACFVSTTYIGMSHIWFGVTHACTVSSSTSSAWTHLLALHTWFNLYETVCRQLTKSEVTLISMGF